MPTDRDAGRSRVRAPVLVGLMVALMLGLGGPRVEGQLPDPDAETVVVHSHLFRLSRPGPKWRLVRDGADSDDVVEVRVTQTGARGTVAVTVRAEPLPAGDAGVVARRDELLASLAGEGGPDDVSPLDMTLDGRPAPGLSLDQSVGEDRYRVQQVFASEHGLLFTLTTFAPAERFAEVQSDLEWILDSFRFLDLDWEQQERASWRELADRCGSEVPWADDWNEAADQARDEGKEVLVFLSLWAGFDGIRTGALMDEEVLRLVQEHVVPWRHERGQPSPLDSYEHYGLGPLSFGSTALLVEPDGTVVGDLLGPRAATLKDLLYARYEPWAQQMLEEDGVGGADEVMALAALDVPDQAKAMLHDGWFTIGRSQFERWIRDHTGHPDVAEALWWRSACEAALGESSEAEASWRELVEDHPDQRWAWLAAVQLLDPPDADTMARRLRGEDGDTLAFLRTPVPGPLGSSETELAREHATAFLLAEQRDDGSWRSPPAELGATLYRTESLTAAVTAICGLGLMPRDDEVARAAVRAALGFVQAWSEAQGGPRDPGLLLDYGPWGYAYGLTFLARAVEQGLWDRVLAAAAVDGLVRALERGRMEGGGWTYRVFQRGAGGGGLLLPGVGQLHDGHGDSRAAGCRGGRLPDPRRARGGRSGLPGAHGHGEYGVRVLPHAGRGRGSRHHRNGGGGTGSPLHPGAPAWRARRRRGAALRAAGVPGSSRRAGAGDGQERHARGTRRPGFPLPHVRLRMGGTGRAGVAGRGAECAPVRAPGRGTRGPAGGRQLP
jgi:hypothetical protein